jgi:hypothetical protein
MSNVEKSIKSLKSRKSNKKNASKRSNPKSKSKSSPKKMFGMSERLHKIEDESIKEYTMEIMKHIYHKPLKFLLDEINDISSSEFSSFYGNKLSELFYVLLSELTDEDIINYHKSLGSKLKLNPQYQGLFKRFLHALGRDAMIGIGGVVADERLYEILRQNKFTVITSLAIMVYSKKVHEIPGPLRVAILAFVNKHVDGNDGLMGLVNGGNYAPGHGPNAARP